MSASAAVAVPPPPRRSLAERAPDLLVWGGVIVLLAASADAVDLGHVAKLFTGSENMRQFAGQLLTPDFTYFGLSAKSALDTLKTTCSPNCTSSETSSGRTKALVADISLGAGVLAIGGAVIWAILANSGKSEAAASAPRIDVQPTVGGAYGSVTARY